MYTAEYLNTHESAEFPATPVGLSNAKDWLIGKASAEGEPFSTEDLEWTVLSANPGERRSGHLKDMLTLSFRPRGSETVDYYPADVVIGTIYSSDNSQDVPKENSRELRPTRTRKTEKS